MTHDTISRQYHVQYDTSDLPSGFATAYFDGKYHPAVTGASGYYLVQRQRGTGVYRYQKRSNCVYYMKKAFSHALATKTPTYTQAYHEIISEQFKGTPVNAPLVVPVSAPKQPEYVAVETTDAIHANMPHDAINSVLVWLASILTIADRSTDTARAAVDAYEALHWLRQPSEIVVTVKKDGYAGTFNERNKA